MSLKKTLSIILLLCMAVSSAFIPAVGAAETETAEPCAQQNVASVGKDYGLMDNIQDGNILHCFCWKHTDIKDMLPQIAEAGFTSVQVSPPQSTAGTGSWWWFYQPQGFYIGSNAMGNKQTLTELCAEAEKYGIKIIVDIVANHLAGNHNDIQNDLKDGQYWHSYGGSASDGNRESVINGTIGMPDLNTGHPYVQQCVRKYVLELKSIGVDGIRWDAAKHIGLPSEGDGFWPAVTNDTGMYHYGEILNNPGVDRNSEQGKALLREYTQYMSVTDSTYGMDLRNSFNSNQAPGSSGVLTNLGLSANKMVYWGESHDTWSNNKDWGYSNDMSQNVIDRAYAVAGSRADATALYFSRPHTQVKDDIRIGAKGSTHFTSPEVAAVNHFRNAMNGQKEYVTADNGCTVVCREQGAVIVAGSGSNKSVTVANGSGLVKPGTYTDEITGSTWTVTSSSMSGQIGSSGIAVIYNPTYEPSVSISQKGGTFKTDTLSLTLSLSNATSGTYSIDGSAPVTFTGTKTITIGSGVAPGNNITVALTATDGTTTTKETYTFIKADPSATGIYFDNSSKNWSNVYCYIYNDKGASAEWPGTKMTNEGNNIWFMDVSSGFEKCYVLFSDGNGNQAPGANEPGYSYNNSPMIYKDGAWIEYAGTKPTPPVVTAPDPTETQPDVPSPTSVIDPTEPITPGDTVILGDADLSRNVNIKDATTIQKHLAKIEVLSGKGLFAADVDSSNGVNIKDVTAIQSFVANMDTGYDIGKRVNYTDGGTAETAPTEAPVVTKPAPTEPKVTSPPVVSTEKTVYFKNTSGWSDVYAYCWGDGVGDDGSWPGVRMTYVSGDIYKIAVENKFTMIIFSDKGVNKTDDLTIAGNGYIFDSGNWSVYTGDTGDNNGGNNGGNTGNTVTIKFVDSNGWGTAKAICWRNSNSSQRDEYIMQSIGNNTFQIAVANDYDKIYFTNDHQWCQDQDFPKNGGTFTYNAGWTG
ncbi:MAG: starch-binding protein [Ruminococcus sp.]